MKTVKNKILLSTLKRMAEESFGNLVKAVVDIEKKIMVVDAQMHADEEQFLLTKGSEQKNLWGINLYPELFGTDDFIEYDSMINIRPSQGNRSRGVDDLKIQIILKEIVIELVKHDPSTS